MPDAGSSKCYVGSDPACGGKTCETGFERVSFEARLRARQGATPLAGAKPVRQVLSESPSSCAAKALAQGRRVSAKAVPEPRWSNSF